ncbi:MAG: hypothetical protein H6Q08_3128, partial [Acidobacteria bacterium]|nr:hypothetical protein [Acidobacteriota bacterium]
METQVLEAVHHLHRDVVAVPEPGVVHQLLEPLLLEQRVDEGQLVRQRAVEDHAPDRGVDDPVLDLLDRGGVDVLVVVERGQVHQPAAEPHLDRRQRPDEPVLVGQQHLVERGEQAPLAGRAALGLRQVVDPEHHVLAGNRDRLAVRRLQDVARRHHQDVRFGLGADRERNVHRHLVAIEVGVERRADQRVDPDRLALDQLRLEGLDPQAVQRRRAVEHHRVVLDHLFEDVPDLRALQLDHLLGGLDGRDHAALLELVVDERLEQLEGHLLGQAALVQFQLGADDDHRPAGVVDALAEQVLSEPALLPLERVGERLERAVVGAAQDAAATAVVHQRVHRLLEHPLLVPDDHVRRAQVLQLRQPVVAVDHPAVEIVQVRGREAAALERHQRAQLGRDHGDDVEDHPLRAVAGAAERVDDLEPLGELLALLQRGLVAHLDAQLDRQRLDIDLRQERLDRLGAHLGVERPDPVALAEVAVLLLREQLADLQLGHVARVDHDVGLEVQHALEITLADVEQVADAARQLVEEPHVRDRRGQLDVAHPLAAHLGLRDLDAALVADDAAVLHALELAAEALPVGHRAED